jgi:hypothetical protein
MLHRLNGPPTEHGQGVRVELSRAYEASDDQAPRSPELVCKLTQPQPALSEPNAVELNEPRFVELERYPRP